MAIRCRTLDSRLRRRSGQWPGTPASWSSSSAVEAARPSPGQAEFIAEVEAYPHGAFRDSFGDVPELLGKLKPALEAARSKLQPLTSQPLTVPVAVPWREDRGSCFESNAPVLETHVVPVGAVSRLRAVELEQLAGRLARGRENTA